MPSSFEDDDPPSNPPPPLSPRRDIAALLSRAAAIISGIGSTVAGVIGAFSPSCCSIVFNWGITICPKSCRFFHFYVNE
jgi:hypothetical protein